MHRLPHSLVSEHNRLIPGPLEHLWRRHAQVTDWPAWNPDVVAVGHEPPLTPGNTFTVITATGSRRIRVYAFVPEAYQLIWGNELCDGGTWLQSWTFEHSATGVRVSASTSVSGATSAAAGAAAAGLRDGVESWMDRLQLHAEARATREP